MTQRADDVDQGELPPLTAEILKGKVEGRTDAEIAADLGLTEDVVGDRRRIVRGRFGWRLAHLGMGGLIPRRARPKSDGEADMIDDLPVSRRTRRS